MGAERLGPGPPSLFDQCIEAAAAGSAWRVQKRSLERLPEHAANLLLARLIDRQALGTAPHLELFRSCVTKADLKTMPGASGQHLVYLSEFMTLQELSLAGCTRLRDAQLLPLAQLHHCLLSLNLRGCTQASSCAMQAISQLTRLRHLDLSETSISPPAPAQLSSLTYLTSLSLDHVQLSDTCLAQLTGLSALCHLSLQCAQGVTDTGLLSLEPVLLGLRDLDVAWTQVTLLPLPPKLKVLHMEHCRLSAVWRLREAPLQLQELHLSSCSSQPQPGGQAQGGGGDCSDTVCDALHAAAATLKLLDLQGTQSFSFTERSGTFRCEAGSPGTHPGPGPQQGGEPPPLPPAGAAAGTGSRRPQAPGLHLPHLKALDLRGCKGIGRRDLQLLGAAAPGLRCLLLGGCSGLMEAQGAAAGGSRIGCREGEEAGGRVWHKLQKLDLSSCNITDADIPWLLRLTSLQHLDLSHNLLTGQPPPSTALNPNTAAADPQPHPAPLQQQQQQMEAGQQMEAMWAAPPDPSGSGAGAGAGSAPSSSLGWEGLVRLRSLLLTGTQLSAAGAQALAPLASSLTHLELGHPALSSDVLPQLTALSQLRHLSLSNSPSLTPPALMRLQRGLPLLTRLELPGSWSVGRKDVLALLAEAEAAGARLLVVVAADGENVLSAHAAAVAAEAAAAGGQERGREGSGGGSGEARGLRSQGWGRSPPLRDCDERYCYSRKALMQLRGAQGGNGAHAPAAAAAAAGPAADSVLRLAVAAAASELLT